MKHGDPIDLAALRAAAESDDGPTAVVERTWLARVHDELLAARKANDALGRVFGRTQL